MNWTRSLLADLPLTAASFIVTVYGDVVVPRGETLWMGSLIDLCAQAGFSESLVRTAMSRLVSARRLEGERNGRRSFYRLAQSAQAEFADAARLLYTGNAEFDRWFVVHAPGMTPETARRHRMARMGGDVWLSPDANDAPDANLTLPVSLPLDARQLASMAGFWDLTDIQARYDAMLVRFDGIAKALKAGHEIAPDDALISRLLLVHVYRGALLRDPCLPRAGLPLEWSGSQARNLFQSTYLALSPLADQQIGRSLEGQDGPLPARTRQSDARLRDLRKTAAQGAG